MHVGIAHRVVLVPAEVVVNVSERHARAENIGEAHRFGIAVLVTAVVAELHVVRVLVPVDEVGDVAHLSQVFKRDDDVLFRGVFDQLVKTAKSLVANLGSLPTAAYMRDDSADARRRSRVYGLNHAAVNSLKVVAGQPHIVYAAERRVNKLETEPQPRALVRYLFDGFNVVPPGKGALESASRNAVKRNEAVLAVDTLRDDTLFSLHNY